MIIPIRLKIFKTPYIFITYHVKIKFVFFNQSQMCLRARATALRRDSRRFVNTRMILGSFLLKRIGLSMQIYKAQKTLGVVYG